MGEPDTEPSGFAEWIGTEWIDLDPGPGAVGIEVDPLGADELGEARRHFLGLPHGPGR